MREAVAYGLAIARPIEHRVRGEKLEHAGMRLWQEVATNLAEGLLPFFHFLPLHLASWTSNDHKSLPATRLPPGEEGFTT